MSPYERSGEDDLVVGDVVQCDADLGVGVEAVLGAEAVDQRVLPQRLVGLGRGVEDDDDVLALLPLDEEVAELAGFTALQPQVLEAETGLLLDGLHVHAELARETLVDGLGGLVGVVAHESTSHSSRSEDHMREASTSACSKLIPRSAATCMRSVRASRTAVSGSSSSS